MYSKHKDAAPEQTIKKIKGILRSLGLEPSVRLLKNTNNIYSASLLDTKHGWHVNGKGTSEEYCLASAYGEAMERLQAYFVYDRLEDSPPQPGDEFLMFPDERKFDISRCKSEYPAIYRELRAAYALEQGRGADEIAEAELDDFLSRYFMDSLVTVPYYSLKEGRVVHLPEQMVSALCGSTGLSAGNTPCEALNQGIAEILERHVKELIFKNGYTPPEVPRGFIREKMPGLYEMILQVEAMGPYAIVIKDASLGAGMPVMGALFVDREHQRYHAKFGASFSMQVAVERCLTELFQGFDLKDPASHQQLMTRWDIMRSFSWDDPANRRAQLRTDSGSVPLSYMAGSESWPFRDWDTAEGYGKSAFDNERALGFMVEKLSYFQKDIYIRSYSFLGFPAYRVFAPGVSVTHLPLGPKRMRYKIEKASVDILKEHPAVRLSGEALDQCFDFLTAGDNLLRDPFDDVPMAAVQAVFYYCYGRIEDAIAALRSMPEMPATKKYGCAAMELELQAQGMDANARDKVLALFYDEKYVKYAKRAFRKADGRQDHAYLIDRVMDPQCKKLFSSQSRPGTPARARMHAAMRQRMRENTPDQAEIAKLF